MCSFLFYFLSFSFYFLSHDFDTLLAVKYLLCKEFHYIPDITAVERWRRPRRSNFTSIKALGTTLSSLTTGTEGVCFPLSFLSFCFLLLSWGIASLIPRIVQNHVVVFIAKHEKRGHLGDLKPKVHGISWRLVPHQSPGSDTVLLQNHGVEFTRVWEARQVWSVQQNLEARADRFYRVLLKL